MSSDVDVQPVPVNKTPLGPEAASQDTTCATFSPSDLRGLLSLSLLSVSILAVFGSNDFFVRFAPA
jgi:hypothetical protein